MLVLVARDRQSQLKESESHLAPVSDYTLHTACMEGIQKQLAATGNLNQAVREYVEESLERYGLPLLRWWKVKSVVKNTKGHPPVVVLERET